MRLGSWAAAAKRPFATARQAFLSPWTGCDKKEEGCGERKQRKKERERRALLSRVGLSGSFEFCFSLNIVGSLGRGPSFILSVPLSCV